MGLKGGNHPRLRSNSVFERRKAHHSLTTRVRQMRSGAVRPPIQIPLRSLFRFCTSVTADRARQFQAERHNRSLTPRGSDGPSHEGPGTQEPINLQLYTTLPCVGRAIIGGASTYNYTHERSLELLEVTDITLDQRLPNGRSEAIHKSSGVRERHHRKGQGYRVWRCSSSYPFGESVFCSEGTSNDLVIVGWVTPSTDPTREGSSKLVA